VEVCSKAGQVTQDSIIRFAYWIPKTTNTLRICNTYYFSIAAMVAQKNLDIRLAIQTSAGSLLYFTRWNPWIMDQNLDSIGFL
jgi:hypothetical protein